jgi:hypothetical protein
MRAAESKTAVRRCVIILVTGMAALVLEPRGCGVAGVPRYRRGGHRATPVS